MQAVARKTEATAATNAEPVLERNAAAGERDAFAAFVNEDVTAAIVTGVAARRGWPASMVQQGGIAAAFRTLAVIPPPKLLIVDLSESSHPINAASSFIDSLATDTRIIALGAANDVGLFRELLTLGITDYLVKPVSEEVLEAAIVKAEGTPETRASQVRLGRLAAVISARGGAGGTTVAANAAWLMAHELSRRVVLVDLDLQFGNTALAFDLEPGRGLREALEAPERIDDQFIDRAMARESERLSVFGGEAPLDEQPDFDDDALISLLDQLRRKFDCVLLDLPRQVAAAHHEALAAINAFAIVSDLSLVGLRDTNRLMQLIKGNAPGAELSIAANQVELGRKGQVGKTDFERGLGQPVTHLVPLDARAAGKGANLGSPITMVERRSKVVAALKPLATALCGAEPGDRKRGRLWRRRSKA